MKELTESDLKKIIARRDPRYDGRFYFGVKTTGIYCRPVCPAKPKPENIVIFKSTAEAEREGYRACLRCHPELAPRSSLHQGTASSISRALRLIEESLDEDLSVETLALKLGFSDRHLRRLFQEHLGASPIEIMITQRLQLARQLLLQTNHSISDIAFASGFESIRRFNECFKKSAKISPREFRLKSGTAVRNDLLLFMPVKAPYAWQNVFKYLKRHETVGLESVSEKNYIRYIPTGKTFGKVSVTWSEEKQGLQLSLHNLSLGEIRPIISKVRNLFDTDHNPEHLPQKEKLKPQGVRVPGAFDSFETAVAIILGQLISTEAAKKKQKELLERFGKSLGQDGDVEVFAFPSAKVLARSPIEEIGITRIKAEAIRGLASLVAEDQISLSASEDVLEIKKQLLGVRGIGPWTAEMVAMRCLRDPDAFPHNDLIVAKALAGKTHPVEPWNSSRAYFTHCLWNSYS